MKVDCGLNGFGRFGLHLLKYWLDNYSILGFDIKFINDDFLDSKKILETILEDEKINFNKYNIKLEGDFLIIEDVLSRKIKKIFCTNFKADDISWLGKPKFFFEASGKNTSKSSCLKFLRKNTSYVIISATSFDADKTLIYSFNHEEFNENFKIISYGSCTVNAYLPLANYINNFYEIKDSDVSIVHNVPKYKLKNFNYIKRKNCTLEYSGPKLLECINKNNFKVNYVLIPYTGISSIDIRFAVEKIPKIENFIDNLKKTIDSGQLKNIYGYNDLDTNPNDFKLSENNMEIILSNINIVNNNIYLNGYFDNENSVTRFSDLVNYITTKI